MIDLVIMKDGKILSESGVDSIVGLLTKDDAHFIGTIGLGKVKSTCKAKKGYNMGEGVCFLYKFVEQRNECAKCVERSPLEQLNWLFQSAPRFEGFYATWKYGKGKSNIEVETVNDYKLCDCIEYLEGEDNDLEKVL